MTDRHRRWLWGISILAAIVIVLSINILLAIKDAMQMGG